MALKCAGPQTHIAIMSGMDRTRSYLCLTLSSVLRDALPCAATVTVFTSAARPFAACPELARAVEVERAPAGIRPIQFYEVVILRTLARAERSGTGETFAIFEDDVVLARNFSARLFGSIAYVDYRLAAAAARGWPPAKHGKWSTREHPRGPPSRAQEARRTPFILSLYQGTCCDTFANLTLRAQSELSEREGGVDDWWSWGNQAMVFRGAAVAQHLAEALRADADASKKFVGLQDLFIHDFATRNNYTMWTTNPSLVQHCGVHSSFFGVNKRFNMALAFADDADALLKSLGHPGWASLGEELAVHPPPPTPSSPGSASSGACAARARASTRWRSGRSLA